MHFLDLSWAGPGPHDFYKHTTGLEGFQHFCTRILSWNRLRNLPSWEGAGSEPGWPL